MKCILTVLMTVAFAAGLKCQTKAISPDLEMTTFVDKPSKHLIIYLSGDGGMNNFSKTLCTELSVKGYAVVSIDSRKYFWKQKPLNLFTSDLDAVIGLYLKKYEKKEFSVVGYSFGADAGIMLMSRLSQTLQERLKSAVFLSPSQSTDLVIKVTDMLGFGSQQGKYATLPELYKSPAPVLCIFGKDEESNFYRTIDTRKNITKVLLSGSHKYDGDMPALLHSVEKGL